MTKCKFGGWRGEKTGERVTDVKRCKIFLKNKSPISSSRFPSTSYGRLYTLKTVHTNPHVCYRVNDQHSVRTHGFNWHILPPPLVSGRTCIYENVVSIELKPLQNGAVGIPLTQVMVEFIHYHWGPKPADKAPLTPTARKSSTYPKDWDSIISKQHQCLQWPLEILEDCSEKDT